MVVGIHCIAAVVGSPDCCGTVVLDSPTCLLQWRFAEVDCKAYAGRCCRGSKTCGTQGSEGGSRRLVIRRPD